MKSSAVLVSLLSFVASTASAVDFSAANALFAQRENNPGKIAEAKAAYAALLPQATADEKLTIVEKSARLDYYLGLISTSNDEKKKAFDSCLTNVNSIAPTTFGKETVQYYYWHATCLAQWCKANGIASSLARSRELADTLDKGLKLPGAATYQGGGLARVSAALYLNLPPINPFGPTRDLDKALTFAQDSLSAGAHPTDDPSASGDKFYNAYEYIAGVLEKRGDRAGAIEQVDYAISEIEAGHLAVGFEAETRETYKDLKTLRAGLGN